MNNKSAIEKTQGQSAAAASSPKKKALSRKKASKKSPAKKATTKKSASRKTTTGKASNKAKPVSNDKVLVLSSVLAINDVRSLHKELVELSNANQDMEIDASGVEMIDTAVLQILLAFMRQQESRGLKVTWIRPSKDIVSKSEVLDVAQYMGLSEAGGK